MSQTILQTCHVEQWRITSDRYKKIKKTDEKNINSQ